MFFMIKKVDVYAFAILIYEVVTDLNPYPDLESGKLSSIIFQSKVVSENYHPKFNLPIKNSLKKLIRQCWSADPNEIPTFDEIFNKLTNKNDDNDEYAGNLVKDKMSKIQKENIKR